MGYNGGLEAKKPNWMIVKEAAEKLYSSGKKSFTRKELIRLARELDPSRPATSLDFEVDLVTVNSSSRDRYRSPEKLFLFRVGRGRYTIYNPETHGPLEKFIDYQWYSPTRRKVIESLLEQLRMRGLEAHEVKHLHRPLSPDIVAYNGNRRIGVWVIDPGTDSSTQLKTLAYAVGSALLNVFDESIIAVPRELIGRIPEDLRQMLASRGIRLNVLREEKRYVIVF